MYERILVPLDGSEEAERVLPHIIALAQKFESSVYLVRATAARSQVHAESRTPHAPEVGLDIAQRRLDSEAAAAQRYLSDVVGRLSAEGIQAHADVADGPPPAAILEQAGEHDCSLIAMTTHGRGGVGRLVYGSVADAVLQRSTIPVLLVRLA